MLEQKENEGNVAIPKPVLRNKACTVEKDDEAEASSDAAAELGLG
jgi:hypothetical protein